MSEHPLACLPPTQRDAVLRRLLGLRNVDIAAQLDCDPTDVSRRIHRARRALGYYGDSTAWIEQLRQRIAEYERQGGAG